MSTELDEKVNLKEIVDISEDEFKRQISAWIDERGISRKLQSKLRADLFEQFNCTKLGRQMTEQHQLAHRIVLSPLILVLNTLVAEFLYTEDCHFTLSVFANEVPYKNTLPNFEETPSRELFRFSNSELNDIFEAIGVSKQNERIIRDYYLKIGGQEALNKSLLYCILKILIPKIDCQSKTNNVTRKPESKTTKSKPSTSKAIVVSSSSQQSQDPSSPTKKKSSSSETPGVKCNSLQISSRYFKYLNRYLEILSDRINDMSKSLADKHSGQMNQKTTVDSSTQEESLKKDLRKIIHNINKLTKSQRKSKRFQEVLNSIERLSASVEKCNGKMEEMLTAVNMQSKEITQNKVSDKKDRFSGMDYGSWLKELKTSEHGRKFIDRLEVSLQKTMEKERENLEKLYEEKTNNYRMLIRLHYKQKYDATKSDARDLTEKEVSSPIDKITPDNTEKLLAETLAERALEKEKQVDDIVQTAKSRLHQLERESEELDQSFQAYLRRQQISKQQMSENASKIWENYSLSKAALTKFDKISEKPSPVSVFQPNLAVTLKQDQVFNSTFYDDVDIAEVLKDLNEIKRLKSPKFNKNEAFPKETLFPIKSHGNQFEPLIDHKEKLFDRYSKVEERMKPTQKLINPKSMPLTVTSASDLRIGRQNGDMKLNMEAKLVDKIQKMNVEAIADEETTVKSNVNGKTSLNEKNLKETKNDKPKIVENGEKLDNGKGEIQNIVVKPKIQNNIYSEKIAEQNHKLGGEKTVEKSPKQSPEKNQDTSIELKTSSNMVTNGHSLDIVLNSEAVEQKKEINSKLFSPLKVNGLESLKEPKFNLLEKLPTIPISNGLNHTSKTVESPAKDTNGFSSKLTTFVSRISDSDSMEMESDQISIGQQRLVKSPDDFWI